MFTKKQKQSFVTLLFFVFILYCGFLAYKYFGRNNYVSHTNEPNIGDKVENTNPNCKHFKSCGTVLEVDELNNGMGKVITYEVSNAGSTYKHGDVLTKTPDQLSPF